MPQRSHPTREKGSLELMADQLQADTDPQIFDHEREWYESNRRRLEIKRLSNLIADRKSYALWVFLLVVCWLAFVGYVILAQGFGVGFGSYGRFRLSDAVVIALITTTTATVVGVFLIVANHLYPRDGRWRGRLGTTSVDDS